MNVEDARRRARTHPDDHIFISFTDETGDGPVVAIKDLADVRGTVTTAGGKALAAAPAERDAPVVERIRAHGCVVMGKTNLHEFAFGFTSANPHYGAVGNPRAPGRIPGGSSGGSAAAVALGLCDWALGSDTGGSIRVPAAYCGVVGFKPTVGRVETEATIPLSRSLDTLGPLALDVRTAAAALEAMTDLRGLAPATVPGVEGLRLAVPEGWGDDLDEVGAPVWRELTAGLPRIPFPDRRRLVESGLTILFREAGDYHAQLFAERPEAYGDEVQGLIRIGLGTDRDDYLAALLEQSRLRDEVERAMEGWDALLVPATRIAPPPMGADFDRWDVSCYTRPFNTTGHPVITLPAPGASLPVGVQVVGRFGGDAALVPLAMALEAAWGAATVVSS
jgi:Asp-tRNA(Asn)/Glu-tRNA(Gln) amidotransferase A subunit family amidase